MDSIEIFKQKYELESGTDVQAYDADLSSFASVSPSANGLSLISAADYAAMKALLDLEIGTDVQAYSANPDTLAASSTRPVVFLLDVGDETTDLTAATGKKTFRAPFAFTLTEVRASVNTAPTDADLIVDINLGGTSVLSTKLTIDATETTSTTAATPAVISTSAITDDGEITIDIDQIGSTAAGKGLKVVLIGTRAL